MLKEFYLPIAESDDTWAIAKKDANALETHIESRSSEFDALNAPGGSSKDIEILIKDKLGEMGYKHEPKGEYANRALRPDYVKKTTTGGIILEVERGKTIDNNMDMLDFWKTHIHKACNYLILLVPVALQHRSNGPITKAFSKVCDRLAAFFEEGNETNVHGLIVVGY